MSSSTCARICPAPIIVSLGTCHAGGFVDDMTNLDECVILTACGWDEGAAAGTTSPEYTQWLYYSTAALRGFYPGVNPWNDGTACDAEAMTRATTASRLPKTGTTHGLSQCW